VAGKYVYVRFCTELDAFNCVELSGVPYVIATGVAQDKKAFNFKTLRVIVFTAGVDTKLTVSEDTNDTDNVCVPADKIVPAGGL
jgi:hypothetical protein